MADPLYQQTIQRARDAHAQEARIPPPPSLPDDAASQVFFASPPRTAPMPFFTPPPQPAIMPQHYAQPELVAPQLTPLGSSRSAETVAPPPMFAPSKKWMAIAGGALLGVLALVLIVVLATHDSSEKKAAISIPTAHAAPITTLPTAAATATPTPAPTAVAQSDPPTTFASTMTPSSHSSTRHRFIVRDGRAALDDATQSLADCKRPKGRFGPGQIRATFSPDTGNVIHVMLGPPFAGSDQGKCIVQKYREAHVDPFKGKPSAITYNFNFPR